MLIQKTDVDIREVVSTRFLLQGSILIAAFLLAYGSVLAGFVRTWMSRDDFSHGFIVPFISLYLVWLKRNQILSLTPKPNLLIGTIVLISSGVMLIIGSLGNIDTANQISFLISVPALVLTIAGPMHLKLLIVPLAYLIFMNPVLADLISPLRMPMQLIAAYIAEHALHIMSIPVFRHSYFLDLPYQTLEVASMCSGLNYIVAIVAVAIPLAILTQKSIFRKITVILGSIVIGIFVNLTRVIIVATWAYTHPGEEIHGPMHIFQGFSVSVVGFIVLFLSVWLMRKLPYTNRISHGITLRSRSNHLSSVDMRNINRGIYIAISFLSLIGALIRTHSVEAVPIKIDLNKLPSEIGQWKELDVTPSPLFEIDRADSQVIKKYRNLSGAEVNLQIAYFSSQSPQKKLIDYRYAKLQNSIDVLKLQFPKISIGIASMDQHDNKLIVAYWYVVNNSLSVNLANAKYLTVKESLLHHRTNGSVVFIWTAEGNSHSYSLHVANLNDFATQLYPILNTYIP